jgi:hypothetical protein
MMAMRLETVEIYSDTTNAPVMRHPGRQFPGVLIQGDTLANLCHLADDACTAVGRSSGCYDEVNELRNLLQDYLNNYKKTLIEAGLSLPFSG